MECVDLEAQHYYAVFDLKDVDKLIARLQQAVAAVRKATSADALHSIAELFVVSEKVLAISYIGTNIYPSREYEEGKACRNAFPVTVKNPITGEIAVLAVDFFDVENESPKNGIPNDHAQELFDCFLNDVRAELGWSCRKIIHVPDETIPNAFAFVKRASEWTALIEKQQAEDQPIESKE